MQSYSKSKPTSQIQTLRSLEQVDSNPPEEEYATPLTSESCPSRQTAGSSFGVSPPRSSRIVAVPSNEAAANERPSVDQVTSRTVRRKVLSDKMVTIFHPSFVECHIRTLQSAPQVASKPRGDHAADQVTSVWPYSVATRRSFDIFSFACVADRENLAPLPPQRGLLCGYCVRIPRSLRMRLRCVTTVTKCRSQEGYDCSCPKAFLRKYL